MKFSHLFAPTLRDDPADAEVISHRLLLRAGYIRRVTSGVYDILPLGLKVLRKIEQVVREEIERAGAQELLMPMVQPADLWKKSGRWEKYGRELLRFVDRHNHASCLGPTHEEVICDLVSRELRSWRQLPMNLYQIQTKFRDEVRPRFGLMRGREFIMKDAYSFHADDADLAREYQNMFDAYTRIFTQLGLKFRAVEADTGSIGGQSSHEFHVLADSGEDLIVHCQACDYAANIEMAQSSRDTPNGETEALVAMDTPDMSSVADVAQQLGANASTLVKTVAYRVIRQGQEDAHLAVCVRGDDQIQEIKLARYLQADALEMASDEDLASIEGIAGFIGPQGLKCRVLIDETLKSANGLIAGANACDKHVRGLDIQRDVPDAEFADIRITREGDRCPHCGQPVALSRGIEVGQVFSLGRQYSEAMDVAFQNKDGKRSIATMGCYGIGISRLMAAVVEQCHDDAGICWPTCLTPFDVVCISLGKTDDIMQASAAMTDRLEATGLDVLWDDRKERPGVKFRDAELMGIPIQVVIGARSLEKGMAEVGKRGSKKIEIRLEDVASHISDMLKK